MNNDKKLSPQERMQRTFRFLADVATSTRDNKATQPDSKEALIKVSERLEWDLFILEVILEESQLSDKISGFIDKGAAKPAKFIRAWHSQQKSVEAKLRKAEAWKNHVLAKAKITCGGKTTTISQKSLANKILAEKGWPQGVTRPSEKILIAAISNWNKSGELQRSVHEPAPLASKKDNY